MGYLEKLSQYSSRGFPADVLESLKGWYFSYLAEAISNHTSPEMVDQILSQYLDLIVKQVKKPFLFEEYHAAVRTPFDHYRFGLDFIRPLIVKESSKVIHPHHLKEIAERVALGENVILLANHQTELDTQAICLMLEPQYPKLAEKMIFVAGHRVIQDPLAIPLSMGCNLLCVYSKKYIEDDPEKKQERLLHNQKTMVQMRQLLSQGGQCIYVAPSGGRDRPGLSGVIEVAKFDPQSIELFWLLAQKSGKKTHFYPLALYTYPLLPPPDEVKKQLGEPRHTKASPVYLAFGKEICMDQERKSQSLTKKQQRDMRAHHIWEVVQQEYRLLTKTN